VEENGCAYLVGARRRRRPGEGRRRSPSCRTRESTRRVNGRRKGSGVELVKSGCVFFSSLFQFHAIIILQKDPWLTGSGKTISIGSYTWAKPNTVKGTQAQTMIHLLMLRAQIQVMKILFPVGVNKGYGPRARS
jgi:hypothetical protein